MSIAVPLTQMSELILEQLQSLLIRFSFRLPLPPEPRECQCQALGFGKLVRIDRLVNQWYGICVLVNRVGAEVGLSRRRALAARPHTILEGGGTKRNST
ncbi:MAG: hypothetical protein ACXVZT_07850, partial [Terriglobales bacterium]